MGDVQHNMDAPYDPPVNSLPYSYPSGYAPPEVSYEYKPPTEHSTSDPGPVQFPAAQTTSSATYEPPSYQPPTYAPPRPAA
ncbi:hypothetical protein PHLGIDRAFT_18189 [Phlebiopsis gigantea 11061_1 CR5-6]|uniref:Uncharacterized protein n=1 Tax=Phlebiopsis gigantea (strain 11061_1 CR5-6) TaxID=745531 RepID=A0A0C3SEU5_PHLG1|nr:hypothetical protein PHLGIDRAFT_18189 [Phlebiopsis gigantea 11061_1 CR5-6]